ncbi:GMC family oxidoreductase [Nocardiopsis sp. CNT312]|uniref:GMC family oxidoreductase n=1 Tax=Nocardiopsis sp. CNT312 TaxID=1137268 RepID=UPI0004B5C91D|nr:GMC family oxidoreductase N-terminal domain-containing protein [Nocardiopsis sp. CNT312]
MFDYVIVGAGSAGCVLAARLSEDPDTTVCLIEAGPADTLERIHIPSTFGHLFRTEVDWDYHTHEEAHLGRRKIYLPRGRVLGGTSSINTMIYIRGNQADFDGWGQEGWSFEDLLPYFRLAEDNERGESRFHGVGGPLSVSENRSRNPMSTAFLEAAGQAGHPANDDFNGAEQEGFGFFQLTQKDGMRCSTATAYLHPAAGRPNLTVRTGTTAHRIVINGSKATGVAVGGPEGEEVIRAEREVLLCGGAYNSPQLLMLSGVGAPESLAPLGIDVTAELPMVGTGLQDHVLLPLVYTHDHPVSLLAAGSPENVQQFQETRSGPMTSNGPEVGGFARTRGDLPAPDVEFLTAPVMFVDSGLAAPTGHALSFGPSMLTPASRGRVELASDMPTAKPRIVHNYFEAPEDMDSAVEALRMALDIAGQEGLRDYTKTAHQVPDSDSDQDLREFVRRYAHSIYHASSTCAMGSVVDADLRVRGVEGLRVADASVMPTLVRGNPNAATITIAERAADLVRGIDRRGRESEAGA